MAAAEQIPLTSATVMARWRLTYLVTAILVVCGAALFALNEGKYLQLAPFALVLAVAVSGFLRTSRFEKLLKERKIAARIENYKKLRNTDFRTACTQVGEDGHLLSFDRAIMMSPSTWGRRQGIAIFDCDPFEVWLYEKNSRVGRLSVFVKADR
jgi:hypothetical protein